MAQTKIGIEAVIVPLTQRSMREGIRALTLLAESGLISDPIRRQYQGRLTYVWDFTTTPDNLPAVECRLGRARIPYKKIISWINGDNGKKAHPEQPEHRGPNFDT